MGDVITLPVVRTEPIRETPPARDPALRVWCKPRIPPDVHSILLADANRRSLNWNDYVAQVLCDQASFLMMNGSGG